MAAAEVTPQPWRYGTFEDVFVPTLLTILGVILYVRVGWVVGNAGLLGAVGIILFGDGITAATRRSARGSRFACRSCSSPWWWCRSPSSRSRRWRGR